MLSLYVRFKAFVNDEDGQTAVEYCIMIGLVGLALIAASPGITQAIVSFFGRVSTSLDTVGASS